MTLKRRQDQLSGTQNITRREKLPENADDSEGSCTRQVADGECRVYKQSVANYLRVGHEFYTNRFADFYLLVTCKTDFATLQYIIMSGWRLHSTCHTLCMYVLASLAFVMFFNSVQRKCMRTPKTLGVNTHQLQNASDCMLTR